MKFTDANVASLKLPKGRSDLVVFDERRPGLGVRLRAGADGKWIKRNWLVQLRVNGRSQRHELGPTSATRTKRARELADEIFAKARQGIDPKAEKRDRHIKAAETFGVLAERFLNAKKERQRARSYAGLEHHIERHLAPLNGEAVRNIDRKMIAENLARLADAIGPVTANRARSALSSFFAWAMGEGLVDANPVFGTTKRPEVSRDRVLSGAELAAVWHACGADQIPADDYGRIVRLLLLTGQRRDEVGGLAESELRRDMRIWSLPGARTKNGRPHDVPLSDAALALLPASRADRDCLFGSGEGSFSGWSRCKERLDQRIAEASPDGEGIAPWVLHDLRRSFATGLNDLGVLPHVIEALLNHTSSTASGKAGVAGVYNRATYAAEKKTALDRWAAHVEKLINGDASNVTAIRSAV